jgi:hypothetical protein
MKYFLTKSFIKTLFKVSFSSFIIYFLWRNVSLDEAFSSLREFDLIFVILGAILPIVLLCIMTLKWSIFIRSFSNFSYGKLLRIYWAGDFLSLFNFGTIGGETYKMISFPGNMKKSLTASVADKLYSFWWYILIAISLFISRIIFSQSISYALVLGFIMYIIAVVLTVYSINFFQSISLVQHFSFFKKLSTFLDLGLKKYIVHAILAYIFVIITFFTYSITLYALGIPFDLDLLYYIPLLIVLLTLPISIQGIGVREYVLTRYALDHGLNTDLILVGSLVIFTLSLVERILGMIPFLLARET